MVMTLLPHYETADVRIEKIVVGPFENNVFVLRSKSNGDAVIIDAANEHELLLDVSKRTGVRRVLTTHGHFDHIQAVTQMRDAGIDVGIAAEDAKMLPSYDFVIPDDDVIEVGDLRLRTIHTPGHTPGSTCFLLEGHPIVFSGDTLFPGGPGNTTFANASFDTIIESIDRRLFTLPRRHARAARPRPRHDDRERVAASRRVDRTRLVVCVTRAIERLPVARRRRRVLRERTARPMRRWSCSVTARAGTTGSGSSRCRCSRATTASSRGTNAASASPRTTTVSRTRAPPTSDLLAILDHLDIERAHVVGQSMGGWAALGLAVAHGDRVRSLVLADTLAGIPIDGWWKTAAAVAARGTRSITPRSPNDFCVRAPGTRAPVSADRRAAPRSARRPGAGAAHAWATSRSATTGSPRSRSRRCSSSAAPTRSSRPKSIEKAATHVPGARVEVDRGRRALAVLRATRRLERPGSGVLAGMPLTAGHVALQHGGACPRKCPNRARCLSGRNPGQHGRRTSQE